MACEIYQIDAFADRPFTGNPAAVCFLPEFPGDEWMQSVAAEMNLSETAFLSARNGSFDLRWFTPTVEVDLCGHATLASAHFLWDSGRLGRDVQATFRTASGILTAHRDGDWIVMDFPAEPARAVGDTEGLLGALGCRAEFVGANRMDFLVELGSEDEVHGLRPDFRGLTACTSRGVMATARSDKPGVDFVSRFFAPSVGVDEDPVTGSAHCCLAPHWADRLGRNRLVGLQASRRTGIVRVEMQGDRVLLGGRAVTVTRGELTVD